MAGLRLITGGGGKPLPSTVFYSSTNSFFKGRALSTRGFLSDQSKYSDMGVGREKSRAALLEREAKSATLPSFQFGAVSLRGPLKPKKGVKEVNFP